MDLSSLVTSLLTSLVIFLVLVLLFDYLSRRNGNDVVYYPNWIVRGIDPWEGGARIRRPFSWIREAVLSTEKDVIRVSGVDSAVYFVFLTTVLGILAFSCILLLPLLLPIAGTETGVMAQNNTAFGDIEKFSMGHVREGSSKLWAFVVATYWVSFAAYYFLWKAYGHVSEMRATALSSAGVKPEQYAILVRDIPPLPEDCQTRKEQVDSFFKSIYPETFYRSMVVTNNKEVDKIWEEVEGYKRKLERADVVYEESKEAGGGGDGEGERPTCRTGPLGLFGRKVDAIEYYSEMIKEASPKLESEQRRTLRERQEASALVFFNSRVAAGAAAQCLHARTADAWTAAGCPEARQVVWGNLRANGCYQRAARGIGVYAIVAATILFYMIPIGFISAFTTLENLKRVLPWMRPVLEAGAVGTVLEAYLPQVVLLLFLALLPRLLMFLSRVEGIPSVSHVERAASGKYFYFSVLNVFIGVTLGGTLFSTFKSLEDKPNSIIPLLATALPDNATFFLTFVALKFFVGYGLELSRVVPLAIYHIKRKYVCKTEAERKEAWAPGDLGYATRVPGDLLIITIVLCYSVISPLIIPFGISYFGLGWLVLRNQVLRVYVPSYESYGRMWPHMHARVLAALVIYQLTMLGYFGVKKFYYAPLLAPLPVLSLIFGTVCGKKFRRFFGDAVALELVAPAHRDGEKRKEEEEEERPNMDHVFRSFVPKSLDFERNDDDQFEDARSQVSRLSSLV